MNEAKFILIASLITSGFLSCMNSDRRHSFEQSARQPLLDTFPNNHLQVEQKQINSDLERAINVEVDDILVENIYIDVTDQECEMVEDALSKCFAFFVGAVIASFT